MLFQKSVFLVVTSLLWISVQSEIVNNVGETALDTKYAKFFDEGHPRGLQSLVSSSDLRKRLEKVLQEMSTGWPEHNIPPLSPYIRENLTMSYENDYFKFAEHVDFFKVFNLNKMEINVLKNELLQRRLEFDFTFPNITAVGKFEVKSLLNLLNLADISRNLTANCDFKFSFENLRLSGSSRYDLFGSVKLRDLHISLELDGMSSQVSGVINSEPIPQPLNNLIEQYVLAQFYGAKSDIDTFVGHVLQTQINHLLVGKKIWDLL